MGSQLHRAYRQSRLLSVCHDLVLVTTKDRSVGSTKFAHIGKFKNKGDKISRVMGSGHSSSFLLSASAERMAGKITEVANFDFREETLDSGKIILNENTATAELYPGTDMERKDKNCEGTKRRLKEML